MDIKKIFSLRKKGLTGTAIADKFNVHNGTIYRVLDPKQRRRAQQTSSRYNKNRYKNDPEFWQRMRKTVIRLQNDRYKNDPDFRAWIKKRNAIRYQKRKDLKK